MRRDLLIGITIGARLSSLAYWTGGRLKPAPAAPVPSATMQVFQLAYHKPVPPIPAVYEGVPDPLTKQPSEAISDLASSCHVAGYTLEATDASPCNRVSSAALYIHPAKLSDEAFDCLAERVRPPYLTLKKVERCRRLMERNSGAPACPRVLY